LIQICFMWKIFYERCLIHDHVALISMDTDTLHFVVITSCSSDAKTSVGKDAVHNNTLQLYICSLFRFIFPFYYYYYYYYFTPWIIRCFDQNSKPSCRTPSIFPLNNRFRLHGFLMNYQKTNEKYHKKIKSKI